MLAEIFALRSSHGLRSLITPRFFLVLSLLLSSAVVLKSQQVFTDPLSTNTLCAGDSITVRFTTSETFNADNAFTLQLSNPEGSFSSGFMNIKSLYARDAGSIRFAVPSSLSPGTNYRVRVIASSPYVEGTPAASVLELGVQPNIELDWVSEAPTLRLTESPPSTVTAVQNVPTWFSVQGFSGTTIEWELGEGAVPQYTESRQPPVVYWATPGYKLVKATAVGETGCRKSVTMPVMVRPENPAIPASAQVLSGTLEGTNIEYESTGHLWVCPGGHLKTRNLFNAIVYVETGGSIEVENVSQAVIYLKNGASYRDAPMSNSIILYEPNASILGKNHLADTVQRPTITFDYSEAPQEGCIPSSVEASEQPVRSAEKQILLLQHTTGRLQITTVNRQLPLQDVNVIDMLGRTVAQSDLTGTVLELDISTLPTGSYFVRAVVGSGSQKQIVVGRFEGGTE